MTKTEALELLHRLSGDHVMVQARLNGGDPFPVTDSPQTAEWAAEAVEAMSAAAPGVTFHVRRDDTWAGL